MLMSEGFLAAYILKVKALKIINMAKIVLLNITAAAAAEKAIIPTAQNQSELFSLWLYSKAFHWIISLFTILNL